MKHLSIIAALVSATFSVAQDEPAQSQPEKPRSESPQEYDPFQGIDENNIIKRPTMPSDITNPGRWRYTPGGRLKPGNIFERFLVTSFISPLFFREEDIGFGGGVAITDIDFRNQRGRENANMVFTYSEEGQQRYRVSWGRWSAHRELADGGIIRDERNRYGVRGEYSKTLTRRFYGFGSGTGEGDETSYTHEFSEVGFGGRTSIPNPGDDMIVSYGVTWQHHALEGGQVENVPSTETQFFAQTDAADDVDQLWFNLGIAFDTRDSLHQPYDGWRIGGRIDAAPAQTDLAPGALFTVEMQGAVPLPPLFHDGGRADEINPPTDTLQVGAFFTTTAGDLPFLSLPSLGGERTLRGYIQNRFTDRTVAHATVEYRFQIQPRGVNFTDTIRMERVGLALFYDIGAVADDPGDLGGRILDSYGIGIRAAFAREAVFRIDYGFSEEDALLTIGFGGPF